MSQVKGYQGRERREGNKSESTKPKEIAVKPEYPSILYESGFLRLSQIVGDRYATPLVPPIVPVSKSTLWSWVKAAKFPAPIRIGPRTTGWRVADVRAWLEKQMA